MFDLPLNGLAAFDQDLSDAKPDVYHGTLPSFIHPTVRADLGPYIIPSKADITRPAAPNFFVEGKSPQGRADVALRQSMIDGAVGARAMHRLQNYGAEKPAYDDKAYSFSSTWHAGTGTLQMYTAHVTQPIAPGGPPEYHITHLRAFAMTSDKESFVKGATAYRNIRDLATMERERLVAQANQVAREAADSQSITLARDRQTSRSKVALVPRSDASQDELASTERVDTGEAIEAKCASEEAVICGLEFV